MKRGHKRLVGGKVLILLVAFWSTPFLFSQKEGNASSSFESIRDSFQKYSQVDYDKALKFSNDFLSKALREKNDIKEGEALELFAAAHLLNNNLAIAKDTYKKYVSLANRKGNDEMFIRSQILASDIELNVPDGAKATEFLDIALERAKSTKNKYWTEVVLNKMSLLFTINGETEKAIRSHKHTLNYIMNKEVDEDFTEKRKTGTILRVLFVLCDSYRTAKKLDSAKFYHKMMEPYLTKASSCDQMYYHVNLGENAFHEGNYFAAKKHYEKIKGLCEIEYPLLDLNMAFRYGKIENKLGNHHATIRILKKGLDDYGVKSNEEAYMDEYYKILAESYKETGDFEFANIYFEKYINTRKEFSQIQDDVSATIRDKELRAFKAELKQLEEEKKAKSLAINVLILGSSVSILILLLLLLRFYRIRKKNEIRFEKLMEKLNTKENKVIDSRDTELEEATNNDIAPEVTEQILAGLSDLEEKNYFLKQDCNSYNVAKKIKTNTSYLSKVVNQEFEKNFNTYINDLRINYAIVQLKEDKRFRSFSIQSIAEELGYKSADSFTKYFKLRTGLNPSFYIKQLNQL